jgi:hypothetical protein
MVCEQVFCSLGQLRMSSSMYEYLFRCVVYDILQRLIVEDGFRVPSYMRKACYAISRWHSLADNSSGPRCGLLV